MTRATGARRHAAVKYKATVRLPYCIPLPYSMQSPITIRLGRRARARIAEHGLRASDIAIVPAPPADRKA